MSTDVVEAVIGVHGGVKFYRGAAKAARAYVERDRSRADDYYLGEGSGVAVRLTATPDGVEDAGLMDGETYEQWVAGVGVDTGRKKGRARDDANALRFVEVTVNGPKTWSLAAALHPDISSALDEAQDKAAAEIVGWVAQHATTRVGPRGRQVLVPVERIEVAVIRHYTSRAGDPHRHLHLQVNARVFAAGAWRGLHSVGVRDMIEAINGIGHAAVATDPEFRAALAAHGLTLDAETGEIEQLAPYVGAFSARTAQIGRNIDRCEAEWRRENPGQEPGPRLRAAWDRRAWAVTPTLTAAEVAAAETGADGHSAAWLIHQHGWRWDDDGHWARRPDAIPDPAARLRPGDLLLIDEAGMLDQDTARALLMIADETGARVALVGDRHQLPAVGRGGLLDHAVAWAHPTAVVALEKVHRFTDSDYAALSLRMRTGDDPAAVFDALHRRGSIAIHPSDIERTAALAEAGAAGDLVVTDTLEYVASLNAAIRDQSQGLATGGSADSIGTARGERIGLGDRVATRRNAPDLGVANRQTWTITGLGEDGSLVLRGRGRDRVVPAEYANRFIELAYVTTVHGAQSETVDRAHVALGDTTGAGAAYVAMTRGRHHNTVHLVAETVHDARQQWIAVFSRERADLGPAHAKRLAADAVDRYGPDIRRRRAYEPINRPGHRREPSQTTSGPAIGA